jgi:hypothetical protein
LGDLGENGRILLILDNIIMKQSVKVLTGYECLQDRIQWQISVNMKMNLEIHMGGNFSTS